MKTCPYCSEEIADAAIKCKHCGEYLESRNGKGPRKKLTRSTNDRILSGVCGGLAEYGDIDPSIVRLLTVLTALLTAVLPVLITYIVMALVIPDK